MAMETEVEMRVMLEVKKKKKVVEFASSLRHTLTAKLQFQFSPPKLQQPHKHTLNLLTATPPGASCPGQTPKPVASGGRVGRGEKKKGSVAYCLLLQLMNAVGGSSRVLRAPILPKQEKASTLRIPPSSTSLLKSANKNQRLHPPEPPQPPQQPQILPPTARETHQEQEQYGLGEFQQYARKNFQRVRREESGRLESNLTEEAITGLHSMRQEDEKRMKSKSALNYAKYFIKQVSNLPTQPSSEEPHSQPPPPTQQYDHNPSPSPNPNPLPDNPSRTSIAERLKSLKHLRHKSSKKCSIEKAIARTPRGSAREPSAGKITGSIGSLAGQESNMIRMKARARNRRVILRVKQLSNEWEGSSSACLLISSKLDRSFRDRRQAMEKIELHLQLLNLLPAYVKEFKQIYEETECWEELIFLLYKKFSLERDKVLAALQMKTASPFRLPFCAVSTQELSEFRNTLDGVRLEERLEEENREISGALRQLYNHVIEKSGRHINLLERDDFSEEIYLLMREEVRLLQDNADDDLQPIRRKRINFTVKCCLLVAALNGLQVDLDAALTENDYTPRQLARLDDFLASFD